MGNTAEANLDRVLTSLVRPVPRTPEHEPVSIRGDFLARLSGKGKNKYARYNGLPLRYAGGKSLAVGHVIEQLPDGLDRLVSPFFGGGSVEIACAKELGINVQGYDIFDVLVNYWLVQIRKPAHLAMLLRQWEPNKETYAKVKIRLKAHWDETKKVEDKDELAALYWFNHNLSYGPGFLGWISAELRQIGRASCRERV